MHSNAGHHRRAGVLVAGNRVYNNSEAGILAGHDAAIVGNFVYSNSLGIWGRAIWYTSYAYFSGQIVNNVVYSNTNGGLLVSAAYALVRVLNNTIYQPVGDAVRLEGDWVDLVNNLVWVLAGHDIYVTGASLNNLLSDYNLLHQGDDPNAHVGFAAGAVRDTLADWQTATGRDAHSLAGDPLFVDLDGADNVLGYRGGADPYDGGPDDNFYRVKHSPAIDRGNAWLAPTTDIDGHARVDDPATPNLGSPDYTESRPTRSCSRSPRRPWARRWVGRPTMRSGPSRCRSPFPCTARTTPASRFHRTGYCTLPVRIPPPAATTARRSC